MLFDKLLMIHDRDRAPVAVTRLRKMNPPRIERIERIDRDRDRDLEFKFHLIR